MRSLRPFVLGLSLLGGVPALLASSPRSADASVAFAMSLERLASSSDAIVVALPVEQRSFWEGGRIHTYTLVRIEDSLAGDLTLGDETWVKTRGGVVGPLGQRTSGEATLSLGRASLLFLRSDGGEHEVVGRAQGQFGLVADSAGHERLAVSPGRGMLLPACDDARLSSDACALPAASVELAGKTLNEVAAEITLAWRLGHVTK